MLSVQRNRAKTFLAALEVLREATDGLIEQIKHNELQPYDEAETERFRSEHGTFEDVLSAFDDALDYLPNERNGYLVECDSECDEDLFVTFKAR